MTIYLQISLWISLIQMNQFFVGWMGEEINLPYCWGALCVSCTSGRAHSEIISLSPQLRRSHSSMSLSLSEASFIHDKSTTRSPPVSSGLSDGEFYSHYHATHSATHTALKIAIQKICRTDDLFGSSLQSNLIAYCAY